MYVYFFFIGDSGFGMHTNKNREKSSGKGSNYNWLESVGLGTSLKAIRILKVQFFAFCLFLEEQITKNKKQKRKISGIFFFPP